MDFDAAEIRFLLKMIVESKTICGTELQQAVLTFDKLQKKLREMQHGDK